MGISTVRVSVSNAIQTSTLSPSVVAFAPFCIFLFINRKCFPSLRGNSDVRNAKPFTSPVTGNRPALPYAFFTSNGISTTRHPRLALPGSSSFFRWTMNFFRILSIQYRIYVIARSVLRPEGEECDEAISLGSRRDCFVEGISLRSIPSPRNDNKKILFLS